MKTDALATAGGELAALLLLGGAVGLLRPSAFRVRWLLAAAGLVLLNDAMLTRVYGLVPRLLPHAGWNWQGKLMALAATLAVASLPAFGWRRSGLTLRQARGSLPSALAVSGLYALFFVVMSLLFERDRATPETVAFQLTLPGLEEEPFFRGVLLLALDRAFLGRARALGVEWGWGAALSCVMFGLVHALSFSHGRYGFDALSFALTGAPALFAVWLRMRTGSVLLPVLLHNFGNSVGLFIGRHAP